MPLLKQSALKKSIKNFQLLSSKQSKTQHTRCSYSNASQLSAAPTIKQLHCHSGHSLCLKIQTIFTD